MDRGPSIALYVTKRNIIFLTDAMCLCGSGFLPSVTTLSISITVHDCLSLLPAADLA